MFSYSEYTTPGKLKDFIECFWVLKATFDLKDMVQEVLVPGGRAEFIFSGNQVLWFGEDRTSKPIKFSGAFLLGQRKAANYLGFSGANHLFGIRLKIGSLPLFTKAQANKFSNKITPLCDVYDTKTPALNEVLEVDAADAINYAEKWLLSSFISPSADWYILNKFIEAFTSQDIGISIKALSEQQRWSPKKTERVFLKYTGFAPRTFLKLLRFRNTMESLKAKPTSFTKAALDLGFYDQSHFIRDFQNYTGKNPSSFYNSPPEVATMLYKISQQV